MTAVVRTNQLEIAYEVDGPEQGTSVLALHGWPDSPRTWDAVVPRLVEGGCRVYRPYLRGFGATRLHDPGATRSGQIAAHCADMASFLDALGIGSAIVAGHDWGARAGYALAGVHPERVAGLLAMSVAYGGTGSDASVPPEQAQAYWYQWFFSTQVGRRMLSEDRRGLCRYLWDRWSPSLTIDDEEFAATAASWDNPDWAAITVHSYSQRWGEAEGDPELAELERAIAATPPIAAPTIVLHGEEDGATLVDATKGQEEHFTGSYERRTLPGVGHFVPREAPAVVADAVLALVGASRR